MGDADDLAAFERKASEVAALVAALKDGSLKPEDVKMPEGMKTEEQVREEEEAKERRRIQREEEAKAKAARDKVEERERWWSRAELMVGRSRADGRARRRSGEPVRDREHVREITDDDGNVLFPKPKDTGRDCLDYGVWDKWVPDDPVSLEEMQTKKDEIEAERNAAFEQANPEFCQQYIQDQEQRAANVAKREREAEKAKVRGNRLFQRRRYADALAQYLEALKLTPWKVALLTNLAQVCLKLGELDDAIEFCDRALFLDPESVKALWRRARALMSTKPMPRWEDAVADLQVAHNIDPDNADVVRLLAKAQEEVAEAEAERAVMLKTSAMAQERRSYAPSRSDDLNEPAAASGVTGTNHISNSGATELPDRSSAASRSSSATSSQPCSVVDNSNPSGVNGDSPISSVSPIVQRAGADPEAIARAFEDLFQNPPGTLEVVNEVALLLHRANAAAISPQEPTVAGQEHVLSSEEWTMLESQVVLAFESLPSLLRGDRDSLVLFRTSGAFKLVCEWFMLCSTNVDDDGNQRLQAMLRPPSTRALLLDLIASACENKKNAAACMKMEFGGSTIIDLVISFLTFDAEVLSAKQDVPQTNRMKQSKGKTRKEEEPIAAAGAPSLTLAVAASNFLERASTHDAHRRKLAERICAFASALERSAAPELGANVAMLISNLAGDDASRAVMISELASCPNGYCILSLLTSLLSATPSAPNTCSTREAIAAAVANLCQASEMRASFTKSSESFSEVLFNILLCKGDTAAAKAFCLAALLNASVPPAGNNVVSDLVSFGAVAILLDLAAPQSAADEQPCIVRLRAAALLSRCCIVEPKALASLLQPAIMRRWVGTTLKVANEVCKTSAGRQTADVETEELLSHTIRVLAVCLKQGSEAAIKAVTCSGGCINSLVKLLRREANSAVGGNPKAVAGTNLGGNLTQCFIVLTNDPMSNTSAEVVSKGAIPPMIELLRCTNDGPVRKNAAITLAKLARNAEYKESIRELRGMEMLVELGGRLV